MTQKQRERNMRQQVYKMAQQVRDQSQLNSILMDIPNRILRREVFELLKPKLKFKAEYSGLIATYHEVPKPDPVE